MAKNIKINNHDLAALGISDITLLKELGKIAKAMVKKQGADKKKVLALVKEVWDAPENAPATNPFSGLAGEIIEYKKTISPVMNEVAWKLHSGLDFSVYGSDFIDQPTMHQMQLAMKLPITKAGALMPDAHVGYGLPVGGVLATDANVVIPYAVGVDIACRMCLSVYDLPATLLDTETDRFKKMLQEHTVFGSGGETKVKYDDTLFDREEWAATRMLKGLKDKAWRQLGSSGTGNHFVEWGVITVNEFDPSLNVPAGEYLALLSHSGSRGFGANIANHYSRVAMQKTRLVNEVKHLAWLDMNCEEGMEYWLAMNLAGDYASANHHEIHNKISRALRHQPIARVENHHNFAWKETLADGTPVIVHRKGATPAGEGVMGIIPGSMAAPGFVVKGKGNQPAINSASHGAGRTMSRRAAKDAITPHLMKKKLEAHGVHLLGGDVDEAPMAYKNIEHVMDAQKNLVEIIAKFFPKIVKMADGKEPSED